MPAYSYKERFVPMVKDGSKRQTIRKRRKKGFAKPGDMLYHYFGMRTKWCKKLRQDRCTNAGTVLILLDDVIHIWNRRLTDVEAQTVLEAGKLVTGLEPDKVIFTGIELDLFAWQDGFRPKGSSKKSPHGAHDLMMRFWKQTHELPFIGDIIHW